MTDADAAIIQAQTGICPRCLCAVCPICEKCGDCQGHHPGCARAPYYRPPKKVTP